MREAGPISDELRKKLFEENRELAAVKGNILSAAKEQQIKTLCVTSTYDGEGKTIAALSLSYALATGSSDRVLLVDGNFSNPELHNAFATSDGPGLGDILNEKATLEEAVADTGIRNLSLLTCGGNRADTLDAYDRKSVIALIDKMKESFDYVILDSDSLLGSSNTYVMAEHFDGIILVVECENTRWEVVQGVKDKLDRVRGNLLGVILNKRKYYIPRVLYG